MIWLPPVETPHHCSSKLQRSGFGSLQWISLAIAFSMHFNGGSIFRSLTRSGGLLRATYTVMLWERMIYPFVSLAVGWFMCLFIELLKIITPLTNWKNGLQNFFNSIQEEEEIAFMLLGFLLLLVYYNWELCALSIKQLRSNSVQWWHPMMIRGSWRE